MKTLLFLTAVLISVNAFAEDETRFDYLCKWKEGQVSKWERHHVNLADSIVDGTIAAIDDNSITFSKNDVQYKLDRNSGVLEEHGLNASANTAPTGPAQCKKVPAIQVDFVTNPQTKQNN